METFESVKPISLELLNYIDTFYFHHCDEENNLKRIIFFPNTKNALTIYQNGKINYKNKSHIRIINNPINNYGINYGGIQKTHIISDIEGSFQKIGIIFKPIGINYFLEKNLNELLVRNKYEFHHFNNKLFPILDNIFNENDIFKKAFILEQFFLENINKNQQDNFELKIVNKAIEIIENADEKVKISELAKQLCVSTKTLNRKFQSYLNCSPKHYCKVASFRKAINRYKNEPSNLSMIINHNLYYDQSDFINNFKTLAGQSPLKVLKHLKDLGNNIFWLK